ncbi:hypothetical protein Bpfe_007435 [Biomphalaria pfeifferi]|uniref:Uncharacterized protein n=1 Tax=Biomphalaria pfeifferi TaxID=112525 RepID=A0AAD8BYJ5_BIOPF|nr:hypothetical protein Bpfe_007435 [Biomphalaria pfeifferi]
MPPDDGQNSDKDSGDEDGGQPDNLCPSQLNSQAKFILQVLQSTTSHDRAADNIVGNDEQNMPQTSVEKGKSKERRGYGLNRQWMELMKCHGVMASEPTKNMRWIISHR